MEQNVNSPKLNSCSQIISILLFLYLGALQASAQNLTTNCGSPGSWTYLNTQAQVQNISGCSSILGSLQITSGISDLSPLSSLTSVQLTLDITGTSFTDLTGLNSLAYIGENVVLQSLNGLQALSSVAGGILIYDSPALTSISALVGLKTINPSSSLRYSFGISIYRNQKLKSLDGLQSLQSVGNTIFIDNCPILTTLSPLAANPLTAPASLILTSLPALGDLTSLKQFTTRNNVSTSIQLSNLTYVLSLSGLEGFTNIGNLTILSNPRLADISVLKNALVAGPIVDFEDNGLLCDFSGLNVSIPAKVPSAKFVSACGKASSSTGTNDGKVSLPGGAHTNSPRISGLLVLLLTLVWM
ncbi:hypothetical protein HK096_010988 [Nowakowskiella sp. JEL0078]|nr:hypothetical protein HK096_010988 [Nowakowskiella sp. JEL0078]